MMILSRNGRDQQVNDQLQIEFSDLWSTLVKHSNVNKWINVQRLERLVSLVIDLNKKYNGDDKYVDEFVRVFVEYLNSSKHQSNQDRLMVLVLDPSRGKVFEDELTLALHFCASLCLYLNPSISVENKTKSLHSLQNDLTVYKLELERRQNGRTGVLSRVAYGMRDFMLLRMFNWLNYTLVHFLISTFGSRIGPALLRKFVSEQQVRKLMRVSEDQKNDDDAKPELLRNYSGFVLGTLLGAVLSAIPLRLSHQTQNMLLPRKHSLQSAVIQESECTASNSFWMMVGAFVGLVMNFGARYGAHMAVLYFLSSKLPAQLLAQHPLGQDPDMAKMVLGTAIRMYRSFAEQHLHPQILSASERNSLSDSPQSQVPDLSMVSQMLNVGRDSLLNQIPLYKKSRITRFIVDRYIPKPKDTSKQANEKISNKYLVALTDKASKGYKWSQSQVARVYPNENKSWHSSSTGLAMWFTSRFANRDLKQERQLFDELHAHMRQVEDHLIRNKSFNISSRL